MLTMAFRPVLPLADYAVNYNYIVTKLCENRNKPDLSCKGKCYLKKEIAKNESKPASHPIKIDCSALDVFVVDGLFSFSADFHSVLKEKINVFHTIRYCSSYLAPVFHPPLSSL